MLFHVRMNVAIPHDLDPDRRAAIVSEEIAVTPLATHPSDLKAQP